MEVRHLLLVELHDSVFCREERVILSNFDILTRVILGPALSNQNLASLYDLAVSFLESKTFRL